MPEGDTIHRTARTLHTALAGQRVDRFESVFAPLTRVDADTPIAGRTIDRVDARGKHLLIWFEGDLVLRTHMRMHGSWHIYPRSDPRCSRLRVGSDSAFYRASRGRPGERWRRPRRDLRILIETASYVAVAFMVPVAEFLDAARLEHEGVVAELGPDVLDDAFDAAVAVARLRERGELEIADALLDQRALAGIGNIYKSEALFIARINPFTRVADVPDDQLARLVTAAVRQMRASLTSELRRWVYGRGGQPCRRCGTPIQRAVQGPDRRSTYWCDRCQSRGG